MTKRPRNQRCLAILFLPAALLAAGLFFVLPAPRVQAAVQVSSWQQLYDAVAAQPEGTEETYQLGNGLLAQDFPLPAEGDEGQPAEEDPAGGEEGAEPTDEANTGEGGDAPAEEALLPGTIVVQNKTVILSGGRVVRQAGFTGFMFDVRGGGALTLAGGTALEGLPEQPGSGLINVFGAGAVCQVEDATLAANNTVAGGAAVMVDAGGRFVMQDGQITGNIGGAIYAAGATAAVEMAGGAVHRNTSDNAAVICLYQSASFVLSGGVVEENTAPNGAVYNDGMMAMVGGSIRGNAATVDGGGVHNNATFALAGGGIVSNTAAGRGSGVFNTVAGTLYLAGGRVGASATDNTIYSEASSAALVITGELASTAHYGIEAVAGRAPVAGDALAVKDRGTGQPPLTDAEAASFTVWDGTMALPVHAEEDRVVLTAREAAVPTPAPEQPAPPGDAQVGLSPELGPWAMMAAASLTAALAACVAYALYTAARRQGAPAGRAPVRGKGAAAPAPPAPVAGVPQPAPPVGETPPLAAEMLPLLASEIDTTSLAAGAQPGSPASVVGAQPVAAATPTPAADVSPLAVADAAPVAAAPPPVPVVDTPPLAVGVPLPAAPVADATDATFVAAAPPPAPAAGVLPMAVGAPSSAAPVADATDAAAVAAAPPPMPAAGVSPMAVGAPLPAAPVADATDAAAVAVAPPPAPAADTPPMAVGAPPSPAPVAETPPLAAEASMPLAPVVDVRPLAAGMPLSAASVIDVPSPEPVVDALPMTAPTPMPSALVEAATPPAGAPGTPPLAVGAPQPAAPVADATDAAFVAAAPPPMPAADTPPLAVDAPPLAYSPPVAAGAPPPPAPAVGVPPMGDETLPPQPPENNAAGPKVGG